MMRVKSPPSDLILEKIKSNNYSLFKREFGKGVNFIFVKISFCRIFFGTYFNKLFKNTAK